MTKRIVKVFSVILAVMLLSYIGYQTYMVMYPDYKTEVAMISAVEDSISATGIVVRNETVIDNNSSGIRNYLVGNGDKVAKDSNVAELYATPQDALDSLMLSIMTEEMQLLDQLASGHRTAGKNLDSVISRIYSLLAEISQKMSQDSYADISSYRLQLLELLNSYMLAVEGYVDVAARQAELAAKIAELEGRNLTPIGYIATPIAGYFISMVDGNEETLDKTSILEMPVADIETIANDDSIVADTNRCKIVSDYVWYYAAVIDISHADRFSPELELTLDFSYAGVTSLPVKVVSVRTDEQTKKAVVTLECAVLNTSLADLRCEEANISFRNITGIIVKRSALRIEQGVQGVFVKYGTTVIFKEVHIVYEFGDYVVSQPDSTDPNRLALYDEIITEGKNLSVDKELR
jgi:hypothetical protein